MTAYFQNKIISILLPFVVIVIADFVWGDTTYAWQWLLMIVISIGYTHYGIGAYYQLATFRRQQKSTFLHVIFVALVLLSAAIIYAFSALGLVWLVAFFVIPYFMLHGYFNEQTLFARSCKKASPDAVLAGIALWDFGVS